ncbi:hypothetical protein C8R45DRAFT_1012122 [Mycena sanguinolenta]|nr:hypothetical protein C8R45DRAFT_1012122 [Mycena sanguinolenta]
MSVSSLWRMILLRARGGSLGGRSAARSVFVLLLRSHILVSLQPRGVFSLALSHPLILIFRSWGGLVPSTSRVRIQSGPVRRIFRVKQYSSRRSLHRRCCAEDGAMGKAPGETTCAYTAPVRHCRRWRCSASIGQGRGVSCRGTSERW